MLQQARWEPKLDFEIHYAFSVCPLVFFEALYILQMEHFALKTKVFFNSFTEEPYDSQNTNLNYKRISNGRWCHESTG